jgi:FKBP-type peptidyl-prolyl cis-trans isomerase
MMRQTHVTALIGTTLLAAAALLLAAEPASQPAEKTESKPSGLKITYVSPGTGAKNGDVVWVLYTGKLSDGKVFNSSDMHGGTPIKLELGRHMVIAGWEEGLQGMQVGEKRTLVIPPALAYRDRGVGPIPPNATLVFEVELLAVG